ncbi:MAG TPA: GNAT family N-acetyltransferase, partial [Allosphingosinicella sp.]|nr:GNAT family N-acetyltransferase [Allosphingosinicella sp.]
MPPPFEGAAALGLTLRPMTDEDLPFVADLYASTRAEEFAAVGWPPEALRAFLAQQHDAQHRQYRRAHPDAAWLIVERGGAPAGRLYLDESESELRLLDISLLPD